MIALPTAVDTTGGVPGWPPQRRHPTTSEPTASTAASNGTGVAGCALTLMLSVVSVAVAAVTLFVSQLTSLMRCGGASPARSVTVADDQAVHLRGPTARFPAACVCVQGVIKTGYATQSVVLYEYRWP